MIKNQEFTYIGKLTQLTGTFKFNGPTHLQGEMSGEIIVESAAKIVLEIGSVTKANIICANLDLYGELIGEIKSSGVVTIYPTAVFEGKIIAQSIEILPGAVINMDGHTAGEN